MGLPPCKTCGTVHERCAGHTKNGPNAGKPCGKRPLTGATVCASHGGAARQVRAAAARRTQEAEAARQVATLGLPRDVTPTDALLEEVRWTAGHVQWLRGKVAELEEREDESGDVEHPLVWGITKQKTGGEDYGTTEEAAPSIWYVLYAKERAHLVAVCQAAIKAGVEERRVRLAEQQGDLVALAITRILDALLTALITAGLAPNLREVWDQTVPVVVPQQLRELAGGAA